MQDARWLAENPVLATPSFSAVASGRPGTPQAEPGLIIIREGCLRDTALQGPPTSMGTRQFPEHVGWEKREGQGLHTGGQRELPAGSKTDTAELGTAGSGCQGRREAPGQALAWAQGSSGEASIRGPGGPPREAVAAAVSEGPWPWPWRGDAQAAEGFQTLARCCTHTGPRGDAPQVALSRRHGCRVFPKTNTHVYTLWPHQSIPGSEDKVPPVA